MQPSAPTPRRKYTTLRESFESDDIIEKPQATHTLMKPSRKTREQLDPCEVIIKVNNRNWALGQ
jgi:hypothetical protein